MGRGKKSKMSKSRKKSKSKKKPRSRKKKAAIILGIVLGSFVIYIPSLIWAAQQLTFPLTGFRLTGFSLIPLEAEIEVDVQLTNPTIVPFPPVAAEYVLFIEGVQIGEGSLTDFLLWPLSSDKTTISQSLSGTGVFLAIVTTIINGFLFEGTVHVKIQITEVTVFGISVTLNIEFEQDIKVL